VEEAEMEIRRDPITQSWVVVGQREPAGSDACPFERPAIDKQQTILTSPAEGSWQVRVLAHPDPLYRIEGEPGRLPDGMYDRMGSMGAHEIVVETPDHNKRLSQLSDEEIDRVLSVWALRIAAAQVIGYRSRHYVSIPALPAAPARVAAGVDPNSDIRYPSRLVKNGAPRHAEA